MAENYAVFVEGLNDLHFIETLDEKIVTAALRAVNDTARKSRTVAAERMNREVNFPKGYLTGENGRLGIAKYATENNFEAIVRGRDRPTSLARFVSGGAKPNVRGQKNDPGVTVEVKPGLARRLPRAFAIRLRNNNVGLAVRTADGKAPRHAYKPKQLAPGLWLIYGPSVDQVFKEVREEIQPDMEEYLEAQFNRQLDLE